MVVPAATGAALARASACGAGGREDAGAGALCPWAVGDGGAVAGDEGAVRGGVGHGEDEDGVLDGSAGDVVAGLGSGVVVGAGDGLDGGLVAVLGGGPGEGVVGELVDEAGSGVVLRRVLESSVDRLPRRDVAGAEDDGLAGLEQRLVLAPGEPRRGQPDGVGDRAGDHLDDQPAGLAAGAVGDPGVGQARVVDGRGRRRPDDPRHGEAQDETGEPDSEPRRRCAASAALDDVDRPAPGIGSSLVR